MLEGKKEGGGGGGGGRNQLWSLLYDWKRAVGLRVTKPGSRDLELCVHVARYLGDMLIAFFQDAIADILSNPLTKADNTTANAALPAAMMNGTNPEDSQCWRNEGLESTVVSSKASGPSFCASCSQI